MAYIRGEDRYQITLFPESIDEYVNEDNPVRVIDSFVMTLDMAELGFKYAACAATGRPPYDPRDLLKLYIYGYLNRVRSSRRLEAEAARNLEVIWLMRKLKPDFKTIADFRKDNKEPIKAVFKQFSLLCKEWALYGQEIVAVDGSKFRAVNSKKSNFGEKKLKRLVKYIDQKVDGYIKELEAGDTAEANIHRPSAQEIQERIKQLQERKTGYEEMLNTIASGEIKEFSKTDPDARLMAANNNGVDVSYNVQSVVDSKHNLIVDYDVINNPTDHGQLFNMGQSAMDVFENEAIKLLADKGYYSAEELKKCDKAGMETYVARQRFAGNAKEEGYYLDKFEYNPEEDHYTCPAGKILAPGRYHKKKGEIVGRYYNNYDACAECPNKDKCTQNKLGRSILRSNDQDLMDQVDKRTRENKDLYRQRQMMVEHPFGTIKRGWGFSYFLTRGLESVRAEAGLMFLAYNLRRVMNILGIEEMINRLQPA